MSDTKYPAVFTMHTVMGVEHCCVRHAGDIEKICRVMGFLSPATKSPPGAECAICKLAADNNKTKDTA